MFPCPRCAQPCQEGHRFCFACGAELGDAAKTPEDPLIGSTLPGGYRVSSLLGVGGMGRVYCAEQVTLGRTVAVKVVHPHLATDEMTAARFLNEAKAASRLSHPNSVAIFDFGRTSDGHAYMVMEFLRGKDLSHVNATEGPLPLKRIVEILKQTLAALGQAHSLGIVHRDLKPENIVLEPLRSGTDFVKVVDFGLAKILEADTPQSGNGRALTRPGIVCGTPEYMSPEHARGEPLDGRSDLYALGVLLFELLAGQVPFVSESPTKTLLMHLTDAAPDPREVAPDRQIPEPFAELVKKALAKGRDERFQDAQAFSEGLDVALVESGVRTSGEAARTATRCRACGTVNALGQKFCGECGAAILSTTNSGKPLPNVSQPPGSPSGRMPAAFGRAPTLTSEPAPRSRSGSLPFAGRDDALTWLESRRQDANAMLASAHVVGDAGTGKTRLLGEFASRCTSRGDHVVLVTPDPSWAKVSDAALRTAIRRLARLGDAPKREDWNGARARAAGGLELLFNAENPRTSAVTLPPAERRAAVAEALRWALEKAATGKADTRALLVVDDLDFIDGSSRNAILDVLAEPPVAPVLVIVSYAPGRRPSTGALPGETRVLGPLPVAMFSSFFVGRKAPSDPALTPLHMEQILAWTRETPEAPPASFADLVVRRTQRLSADARQALHAIAVWGDDATVEVLKQILPDTVDVPASLSALTTVGLAVVEGETVRVAHPLLRRVISSSIPAGLKRDLFEKCAEHRGEAPLELRARLAMHGGGAFEALSLLDSVANLRASYDDRAGSVSALRHALDVARRELHRGELDDPVEAVLVFARKLGEALSALGQWPDAEGVLREALGLAPPASGHRAHLLAVLAQVASSRSQPREARQYIEEALRVARQSNSRTLLPLLERLDKTIAVA